jgi:nucleoside-diphosphate-sugar epimerase
MEKKKVVVFGALGLVGRSVIKALEPRTDWEIVGVSRRAAGLATRARFVSLDLNDARACRKCFTAPEFADVTHVVYAALYERPELIAGWRDQEQIATNTTMLVNALTVLGEQPSLRHLTLLQGTKAYGAHVAPMRIPGREREPRHPSANFYWNQEDHVKAFSRERGWAYSIMRPQVVCGFALGSPMNMLSAIGVYAAIQRELGEPLRYPGGAPNVIQATDADLLARAIVWAAETPGCANETFNIANGDVMVWREIFRVVAAVFGMELADPQPSRLTEAMPRHADLWQRIVAKHGLEPHSMDELIGASWQFADAVFGYGGSPRDALVSTVKARRFGFVDCVDTEEMFIRQLTELQAARILPR